MVEETSPLLANAHDEPQSHGAIQSSPSTQTVGEYGTEAGTSTAQLISIIGPLTIGIFLSAMDQTVIVASYPLIGNELKQLQKTSWIATSYMLTVTTFQPLYGKLSDIFGRKTCLLFTYCVFGIGCLLCGLSKTMDQLILARALAGIGGGGIPTVGNIIVSDVVPLRSRGTWQGFINIIFSTGSMIGAPLGGLLADTIGWRWAFLIQVPIVVTAFLSVSLTLHLPQVEASDFKTKIKRVDFLGAVTLIFFVFFFLFGLERGGNVAWNDQYTTGALAISGVSFIFFALTEMKWAREPFAPRRIIVNPSLIAAYLVNFFAIASEMSMVFQVSLYYQAVRSYSAAQAGLAILPAIAGGVLGSLTGGLVIQATGKYYLITALACFLQMVGLLDVVLGSGIIFASVVGISAGLFVSMLGNGAAVTTSLVALIANAGKEDQAIATAVSYLFRSLGAVVGISAGSTILQDTLRSILRHRLTGHDVNESTTALAMKFFSVLTLASLVLATPFKRATVDQVKADIAQISTQVKALDSSIKAFPDNGGSLGQALAIHKTATQLVGTLNQGTKDVNDVSPPSEYDSQDILNSVEAFVPDITSALQAVVKKKPAFQKLAIGGIVKLVKQDLASLGSATKSFEDALISKAPNDLKSKAQETANKVNKAFADAQAAYADV
ncbi:hypothetical protein PQX77_016009 [Marasmius sp. AFHP31]|nr:hypothetical protein PQX77_016009 [Marasmius sp. AFHP31]